MERDFKYAEDEADFKKTLLDVIEGKTNPNFATDSVEINFRKIEGGKICIVDVDRVSKPVYLDDEKLWVRRGSSKKPLVKEDRDGYIVNRFQNLG